MVVVNYEWSSKGNSKAIEDWATRFLCHLEPELFNRKAKTVYVDIEINYSTKDRMVGYCHGDCEEITIELNEELLEDEDYFKETLAHELIHAKQLLMGELKDEKGFKTIWKGEEYINFRGHLKESAYRELPWEAEAYSRQSEHNLIDNERFFK